MKILFIIKDLYKGGAEVSLINLLREIQNDFDIDLLVIEHTKNKKAISLLNDIPTNIRLIRSVKKSDLFRKIFDRIFFRNNEAQRFGINALITADNNRYDLAINYGEWNSLDFLCNYVNAKQKAVWIHNDLIKDKSFYDEQFFMYYDKIDKYIFASNSVKDSFVKKYYFAKEKSCCIHNFVDSEKIKNLSIETLDDNYKSKKYILTCANVREEKNHLRCIDACELLIKRKINVEWINIGAISDKKLYQKINNSIKQKGIDKNYIFLGPKSNPYKYMKNAKAVIIGSDYESWSLVITEAKVLGIPVISTKTYGALEQIENNINGLLCDFTAESIADNIEKIINNNYLSKSIRKNLEKFDCKAKTINEFYDFINSKQTKKKELLYVIDDVNYYGGAHVATKNVIKELNNLGRKITIFSSTIPNIKNRKELSTINFINMSDIDNNKLFNEKIIRCLFRRNVSWNNKKIKILMSYYSLIKNNVYSYNKYVLPKCIDLFSEYSSVVVMSEGSVFREFVANCTCNNKIQFIHTDYSNWKKINYMTSKLSENDNLIYPKFNKIVVLTEQIKKDIIREIPELENKVIVLKNIMNVDNIKKLAFDQHTADNIVKFIVVSRIDRYKGFDRLYSSLEKLYNQGYIFDLTVLGTGEDYISVKSQFESSIFEKNVRFLGQVENPYKYIKDADVMLMLSRYEGLSNVIYESMIIGTPVLATNVSGVKEQISPNKNGWIVENDNQSIYLGIKSVLDNKQIISKFKKNLKKYNYDNSTIIKTINSII